MSRRNTSYKDGTVQTLAVSSPAEPLNAMPVAGQDKQRAKPVLPSEGCSIPRREGAVTGVVPVISKSGKPLMPCKPSKARRLIKRGLAAKCWNKLGGFYIKLMFDPQSEPNAGQSVALGLDPGSGYDGVAIASECRVQTTAMLELPTGIADKLTSRRGLRRARRYRNCRRRPKRFDNRRRPEGWIAPSQKAKVDFRLKIISELCKLYPVTDFVVEDVAFNHYTKRWGKHFSTVEIGKARLYSELQERGRLKLYEGWDTKEEREALGLRKSKSKSKRSPESHAVDALTLCASWLGTVDVRVPEFWVFKRPNLRRRSLHMQNPAKSGVRRVNGGTVALGIQKNTVCLWRGQLYRTGGSLRGRLSLHDTSLESNRVTQNAKLADIQLLYRQAIFSERWSGTSSTGASPVRLSSRRSLEGSSPKG